MNLNGVCLKMSLAVAAALLFAVNVSLAATGQWNSTVAGSNAFWTNSLNWSASPFPDGNQTATFNNNGNGNTTIDLTGLNFGVSNIVFDTFYAVPYTLGSGGANAQPLVFTNNSILRVSATVLESQRVAALTLLGTDRTASAHTFRNDSPAATLTLAGNITATNTSGTAGAKTLTTWGSGPIAFSGNISPGTASSLTLYNNTSGQATLTGSNRLNTVLSGRGPLNLSGTNFIDSVYLNTDSVLTFTGTNILQMLVLNGTNGLPASVTLTAGSYLALTNGGSTMISANQDAVINGPGAITLLPCAIGNPTGDNYVAPGKTLTINAPITGPNGLELYSAATAGTYVLNGINDFYGSVAMGPPGTLSVSKIGNKGSTTSNLGRGTTVTLGNNGSRLLYTGTGETSDRTFTFNNNVILDQSGSGNLVFSASPTLSTGSKTLKLQGSSAGTGEFSAVLANSSSTLSIFKTGTGTWIFSANNTYSGTTVVDNGTLKLTGVSGAISASTGYTLSPGGTLLLDNTVAANNTNRLRDASAILLYGGTLRLGNDGGETNFGENAGALTAVSGASTIDAAQAAPGYTSTLRFLSLARSPGGSVNFTGTGLGESPRNRIIISTGLADGPIGSWATVNGTNLAAYSSVNGVYADATAFTDIAARGPDSTIVSNDASNVRISLPGDAGPIQLDSEVTRVASLSQNTATPATVNTASKSLQTATVTVPAGTAPVTIGASAGDGTLAPLSLNGELNLNSAIAGGLVVNAVVANNGAASSLTKSGAGTAVLNAANTFSGSVTVGNGQLVLANSDALQYVTLENSTGVVFDASVATHAFTFGNLTNAYTLTLEDNAANPIALSVGKSETNSTFAGSLAGPGSLIKIGGGTLTLSGASTHTGGTAVTSGTLVVNNLNALGTGPVANNATLTLTAGTVTYSGLANALSGAGTVNVTNIGTGTGSTTLNGNYAGFTGVWNVGLGAVAGAGKIQMNGADNGAATINILTNASLYVSIAGRHAAALNLFGGDTGETLGQLRLEANAVWAGPVTLRGPIINTATNLDALFGSSSGWGFVSGVIDDLGAGYTVDRNGSGGNEFNALNTYTGPTWVKGGTLRVTGMGTIGGGASPLGASATPENGTLKIGQFNSAATFTYAGMGETSDRIIELASTNATCTIDMSGSNTLTLTSDVISSLPGNKQLRLQGSTIGTGVVAGVIYDNGTTSTNNLFKTGSGVWTLAANNQFKGNIVVDNGALRIKTSEALGNWPKTIQAANNAGGADPSIRLDGTDGDLVIPATITFRTSSIRAGAIHNEAGNNTILGDINLIGGDGATHLYSDKDKLTIIGNVFPPLDTSRELHLRGNGDGEIAGVIANGFTTNMPIYKEVGAGTWTFSGANTYSGATYVTSGTLVLSGLNGAIVSTGVLVSAGASFRLQNNALSNNANRLSDTATVTMNGGAFSYSHTGGAANYSETAGALVVNSLSNTVTASQADEFQSSILTFASLTRNGTAAVDFRGAGLGVDARNKILFATPPPTGLIGLWATYNTTDFAAYDPAKGIVAATAANAFTDLTAKGPALIPDSGAINARINSEGTDGPIGLTAVSTNNLKSLLQNWATSATVGMTNQTLLVNELMIAAGKSDLTLGTAPDEGLIMPLAAGGTLTLNNQAPDSVLTLNAAVTNNASASNAAKFGPGNVALNGRNSYTGTTLINQGALEFGGTSTQALAGVISGAGALTKSGSGRLTLSGNNTYAGVTTIKEGVVVANNNNCFGSAVSGVVIEVGATLDVAATMAANTLDLGDEAFIVSGAGYNGRGAIVNSTNSSQYANFNKISLAGHTTFGGDPVNARWDLRRTRATVVVPTLLMNGFNITKVGSNMVAFTSATVTPGSGNIEIREGALTAEVSTMLGGSSNNVMTIRGNAWFDFYNLTTPIAWSLNLDDNARVTARNGNVTTQNIWAGPVTVNGLAILDAAGTYSDTFSGDISGNGSILKATANSTTYFTGTNNTYLGTTTVSNGTLYAKTTGSLPGTGTSRVTVLGGGTLMVPTGDGTTSGWTYDQIRSLYDANTFNTNTAALGIDTTLMSLEHPGDLAKSMALTKQGTNSLALLGINTFNGALTINGGEVTMTAAGNHRLGNVTIGTASFVVSNAATMHTYATNTYVGNSAADFGRMTLAGNAAWGTVLPIQNTASPNLYVGYNGRGVLTIQDNAILTNKIIVGSSTSSHGAIYQRGNSLLLNWGGQGNDGRIGENGYGYYELSSGTMTNVGFLQVGYGTPSVGILSQFGGNFQFSSRYGGTLALNRGGTGVVYLAGGSFKSAVNVNLCETSGTSTSRGFADFTVDGAADAQVAGTLNIADRTNAFGTVNLIGGTLTANTFSKGNRGGSFAYLNFGGGTFRARTAGNLFGTGANTLDGVYVYPGGATFDSTNLTVTANANLLAPTGNGVSSITVTPRGGYIGPPFVTIAGGGGTGATAIAQFDSANGIVTGVKITCSGFGYRTLPTVSLSGGGTNLQTAVTGVTLAPNLSGGLTKLGISTLTLGGTNTYAGTTTISNGTLKLGNALALPSNTPVVLAGGTLDLSGFTVTNTITGSGLITNGTVVADLSPAGTNVIGTQSLTLTAAALKGAYFADVALDGTSDRLSVTGALDLSNLTLQIVNPALLSQNRTYTIVSGSGARTGTFSLTNLPDTRWHVLRGTDGTVRLAFNNGLVILLK